MQSFSHCIDIYKTASEHIQNSTHPSRMVNATGFITTNYFTCIENSKSTDVIANISDQVMLLFKFSTANAC